MGKIIYRILYLIALVLFWVGIIFIQEDYGKIMVTIAIGFIVGYEIVGTEDW